MRADIRSLGYILQLKFRRKFNQLSSISLSKKKKRSGSSRKKGNIPALLLPGLFFIFFINGLTLSNHAIEHLILHLGPVHSFAFLQGASFISALILGMLIIASIGFQNKELSRLDWDIEWLWCLPVSISVMYTSKIIEHTFLNFFSWIFTLSWYSCLFWYWKYSYFQIAILTFGLGLLTNYIVSIGRFILEFTLRAIFAIYHLRNIQALASVLTMALMMVIFSIAMEIGQQDYFIYSWIRAVGLYSLLLPTGLGIKLIALGYQGKEVLLLLSEVLALTFLCISLIQRVAGKRFETGGGAQKSQRHNRQLVTREFGLIGKEITLLIRDKHLLLQVALMPLFLVSMQLFFAPEFLKSLLKDPLYWGTASFVIGAYSLQFSTLNLILHEKKALWVLYVLPHSFTQLILKKIAFWIALAEFYALFAFSLGWFYRQSISWYSIAILLNITLAIALLGIIGASLGVIGSDPLNSEPQKRMRIDIAYLFMLLMSLMAGSLMINVWQRIVYFLLFGFLGLALWQKASEQFFYLLDASPDRRREVDLADGLICVVLFSFLQFMGNSIFLAANFSSGVSLTVSFFLAGMLSVFLVLFTLWRHGVQLKNAIGFKSRLNGQQHLKIILFYSTAVIGFGFIYLYGLSFYDWDDSGRGIKSQFLFMIAVLMAPFFEEIMFRGLVFKGLLNTFSLHLAAAISALIFALVHPPISMIPVFFVGISTALAYDKTKSLWAPMAIHGLYNLSIVFYQTIW